MAKTAVVRAKSVNKEQHQLRAHYRLLLPVGVQNSDVFRREPLLVHCATRGVIVHVRKNKPTDDADQHAGVCFLLFQL